MKIPIYIPILGIIVSFALILFVASSPNMPLLIAGLALLHLSGLLLTAKFIFCFFGFFSMALDTK